MASNLLRAGVALTAWNRSIAALERVVALGATKASSAREALRGSSIALLMLANEAALDEVLERDTPAFEPNVADRLIVHMGTTSPTYSRALRDAVVAAGGRYVEAPVSGSRVPAERGALVGMLAGDASDVQAVRDLVAPMCTTAFVCGAVPNALTMKLAVNLYLVTMVTGLVEATHFASHAGLDLELFRSVVDAGPMASDVSRIKLDKLVRADFAPQAGLSDVLMNSSLIVDAARQAEVATPLIDQARQMYVDAEASGFGALDMVGVSNAYELLTGSLRAN
jgi:3-hydroxyisobutyrate dehydrogenase